MVATLLDRHLDRTDRLDLTGIDFRAFADQPLSPDVLRCIRYMHDVEHHTTCYLRNLLNTRAHDDPEVTTFLTLWNFEEFWHGEALGRVLDAHGEAGGPQRVATMRSRLAGWKQTVSPLGWTVFSAAVKNFLAIHMTFGVVNEWTTQAGYSRLIQVADHPVLTDLLRRIMKQEGLHIDYYRAKAVECLDGNKRAQRVTRFAMKRLWDPVGSKVMPAEETRHLVNTLFGGAEGQAMADRIDRRIDALPGLGGLDLMNHSLSRLDALC